jgi:hypothetical protein
MEERERGTESGLPDFSWYNIPQRIKTYQNVERYTKTGGNISNGHKMYQIAGKFTK